ncbi:hypothetical protein S7711_10552 [Stachybotrys chartarum IBT 7711]|uniref:Uncharacterized protein n=1 Tax=Stachybotrys chartarum (strain CBS 109288 / IBT 7711) TaxID=1280523 RepID=A0A084ARM7_STACB|nr:hypothetical protein S7711_10552 [Stachybotrys chartarum IBT 7711]
MEGKDGTGRTPKQPSIVDITKEEGGWLSVVATYQKLGAQQGRDLLQPWRHEDRSLSLVLLFARTPAPILTRLVAASGFNMRTPTGRNGVGAFSRATGQWALGETSMVLGVQRSDREFPVLSTTPGILTLSESH